MKGSENKSPFWTNTEGSERGIFLRSETVEIEFLTLLQTISPFMLSFEFSFVYFNPVRLGLKTITFSKY